MTRTRYSVALVLQSFGVILKSRRMTDAAFEAHLMQDGEELLGKKCWQETENIEELSMEYWNIRRLEREQQVLSEKIATSEKLLEEAHEERTVNADRSKGDDQELFDRRELFFSGLENLNLERDQIKAEAEGVKRQHEALQMKARVLKEEGLEDSEEHKNCQENLIELKERFNSYKGTLSDAEQRIEQQQEKLSELQKKIENQLQGTRDKASGSYSQISRANKDITKYMAELGLLQDESNLLFRDVGRYLQFNYKDPACKKACAGSNGLVVQLNILRNSIQWNRQLVERVSN